MSEQETSEQEVGGATEADVKKLVEELRAANPIEEGWAGQYSFYETLCQAVAETTGEKISDVMNRNPIFGWKEDLTRVNDYMMAARELGEEHPEYPAAVKAYELAAEDVTKRWRLRETKHDVLMVCFPLVKPPPPPKGEKKPKEPKEKKKRQRVIALEEEEEDDTTIFDRILNDVAILRARHDARGAVEA